MASPESWQKPEQQSLSQVVQAESVNLSQSVQAYFQPLRERSEIRQGLPLALDLGSMSDLYGTDAYTGKTELKKEPAIMSDEIEQKPESAKQLRASEVIKTEGNFTTQGKQGDWDKATEAYRTTKYQSATHEILTDAQIAEMQAKGQGEKFEITGLSDNKSHQARRELIAQAISDSSSKAQPQEQPQEQGLGADGRWHFQNPRVKPGQDIAGAIKEWIWNDAKDLPGEVAQAVSDIPGNIAKAAVNGFWNVTVGAAEGLNRGENSNSLIPEGATMDYLSGIVHHPEKYTRFGGTPLNLDACEKAYNAFGLGQMNLPHDLVPGLIWNELLHRKPEDAAQEARVTKGEAQDPTTSIGPGQIQIRNIQMLAEKYPQLKQFGDPVKAAMEPATAPFFVAAYVANEVEGINLYNQQHSKEPGFKPIPINADTLAYRYNPDVYSDDKGQYRSLEPWEKTYRKVIGPLPGHLKGCPYPSPEVLQHSHHLQKVREARADLGNSW
jgi:hypothetical protein